MVVMLASGSSGLGSRPGWEHCCCVVGQDTLPSLYLPSPRPGVLENLMLRVTLRRTSIMGRRNTQLVASCFRNWDKLRPNRSIGSYVDRFFFLPSLIS